MNDAYEHGAGPGGRALGEALRAEADTVPQGPAPVDEVVRRGRAARTRRRALGAAALAGTGGALLGVLVLLPVAREAAPGPEPAPAPPASAPEVPAPPHRGVRTVAPYESVPIGRGWSLALLPEGAQNHVLGQGNLGAGLAAARGAVGDNIPPESLSGGAQWEDGSATVLYTGAFRSGTLPARITVRTEAGTVHPAGMLRLPGDPGWGVYHVFADEAAGAGGGEAGAGGSGGSGTGFGTGGWTVTAYRADGTVLLERHFDRPPG
ncbi:hypothetical protein [Streptomyces sp. NPDC005805]|uniref:hypothetical protein n=1 Tax=Streptomyces sp. NPDC005805 TaxID=3157068 RepID=UPI0033C4B56A